MAMKLQFRCLSIVAGIGLVGFIAGCPMIPVDLCAGVDCEDGFTCDADTGTCVSSGPQAFLDADATRGGSMYDKWWAVAGLDAPTDDHPFWSTQATNTRSGADTWRCKECHGWDYKGVDGAYGSGSHMTGFAGIFEPTISAQEAFDAIKTDHGYDGSGLTDDDIWDLAKFVLEGQVDTDDILDGAAFNGSLVAGQSIYESTCFACHGADGLAIPPGADPDHDEFVGLIANENPWEFQHKVRFGQPATAMPPQANSLTLQQVADLATYAQTLPMDAEPVGFGEASVKRGGSLYDKWWVVAGVDTPTGDHPFWSAQATNTRSGADTWRCKECHGWDYKGVDGAYGSGSHMTGFTGLFGIDLTSQETFDKIKVVHGFGTAGLSDDDIWDLAKFVLEGQIDTDDIIDVDNTFIGDAGNGQTLYDGGIGGNLACAICHGADGLTINFKTPPDEEFIGGLASGNPWEFQHKVRFGNPGTQMPAAVDVDATNDEVADVGAYAQTLP